MPFSRNRLIVAAIFAGAMTMQAHAAVAPLELVGPVAEYKLYVNENIDKFVEDVRKFTDAVKAGKIDEARALFAPTRMSYERIEPVAELFSDLDASIDSRADDHEKAEKDPGFIGFHRIEYALWEEKSTDKVRDVADKLMADVLELQKRLSQLTFPPEKVVGGAAVLMEEVAATKISGEEDRYSHTDLWDFQANFEGSYHIFELLRPLVEREDKAFVEKTDGNFKTVFDTLAKYKTAEGGFQSYEKLSDRDRKILAGRVNTLAEDLSQMRGMLGLD
ncbi:iron uptake system protein EfeO [Bordetella genomosp. 4]|uniref:EfeM/EfeO family lipoprotein n=1 Tax=Bordetella genomosp. 4 TaxID=463044 RepID=A0A261TWA9_9BORD|nr:iron uptake system protein EfeO [Bordetella genomosp. 4]OZI44288.1 EfeM/EfeO family lipoprotein [Bordetella genomosp. 4]OZI52923.1 EfeM/EfeO family lipoprotein [Bordetella genomosp. 4]